QGLEICAIAKPFFLHAGLVAWADIVQVHEAKGNHLACQGHSLKGTPYVITRRIDKPPTASWLNRRLYRNAAASVAVSNAVRDAMQAKFPDVSIEVLPESSAHLPSNPEHVAAIRERFAGKFLIGHVGALVQRHKGQLTLLKALRELNKKHDNLQLLLIGTGEDEQLFRQEARDLDNVSFEGFTDDVGDYLAALDLFVYPSLNEGLGSVLFDVMDYQLPIVASRAGGIPDTIQHEKNGLLVPPGDVPALTAAISRLLDDESLRASLAEQGKRDAERFTPKVISQLYLELFERILK
ncbi:MAG: glycosyltransferase family 4 protein, partial [Salinisphaeraceae bacterium]|nr:glycosyltransferase family 4 protein [Salinisphaeraceae bacterium]